MSRDRMSKQPVGIPLTYSDYRGMVFEEPIILHSIAQRLNFQHWAEHIYSFFGILSNEPPQYSCEERLDILIDEIANGLKIEGFYTQSEEITNVKTQDELNKIIIKQYTEETNLYLRVNKILRRCHNYQNENNSEDDIKKYEEPLAAWILQLNSAIRREPYYEKKHIEEQLFQIMRFLCIKKMRFLFGHHLYLHQNQKKLVWEAMFYLKYLLKVQCHLMIKDFLGIFLSCLNIQMKRRYYIH
ncbi:hypothetical protein QJR26_03910 [Clostridium baratii]